MKTQKMVFIALIHPTQLGRVLLIKLNFLIKFAIL